MLQSIRLRNLRSFADTDNSPYIDLKPITVLIGKNSSGKSTFLRSLPLLRQSVEANTTGPILWYSSYVDFGAFSEAKKFDVKDNIIYFDFKIQLSPNTPNYFSSYYYHLKRKILSSKDINTVVEVGVTEINNKTILKKLSLQLYNHKYLFVFNNDKKCDLYIDGTLNKISEDLGYLNLNQFLPLIGFWTKDNQRFDDEGANEYFYDILHSKIKKYFGNTNDSTIKDGLVRIGLNERDDIKGVLTKIFKNNRTFIKNLEKKEKDICDMVYQLSLSASISSLLVTINNEIVNTFKNIKYIAPLRSTAERYYRHQDLQVKEIDHTGSNLAMLLRSLPKKENELFTQWTNENFGFQVKVEEQGLHYALKIKAGSDPREYNINDMGFGFSQILPIVASIWMETSRNKKLTLRQKKSDIIFAIEQPELHLHPEYQARLARMFVSVIKAAKERELSLKIIFETHSQTMVDTLGDCIEDELLSSQDVNIVLFEKELDSSTTKVKFSYFNSEGLLESWPIGFFSGRK